MRRQTGSQRDALPPRLRSSDRIYAPYALPPRLRRWWAVCPEEAWIGEEPQSMENAASELSRPGEERSLDLAKGGWNGRGRGRTEGRGANDEPDSQSVRNGS